MASHDTVAAVTRDSNQPVREQLERVLASTTFKQVDRLKRERPDVKGVVTATRGNHGQSLAFACHRAGIACTVVVPFGTSGS